jgi:molybdate transport system substrate-binding protein
VLGRRSALAAFAAAITVLVVQANATEEKSITVFAAASMKNALDEVDSLFTKQSGIKVVVSYAASSALMKQIEQGAPADIFLSADIDWMDYGAKHNLIKNDSRENLLGNRLVLIALKNSKIDTVTIAPGFDLAGLAGNGRIATRGALSSRRTICQGGTGKARCLVQCRTETGDGGKRARGSCPCRSRRGAAWDRLRN